MNVWLRIVEMEEAMKEINFQQMKKRKTGGRKSEFIKSVMQVDLRTR
jgi:hypothetical protein